MKIWWLDCYFITCYAALLERIFLCLVFPIIHTYYIHIYIHVSLGQRVMSRCAWVVIPFFLKGKTDFLLWRQKERERECEGGSVCVRERKGGREWGWKIPIDSVWSFRFVLLSNFFFSFLTYFSCFTHSNFPCISIIVPSMWIWRSESEEKQNNWHTLINNVYIDHTVFHKCGKACE